MSKNTRRRTYAESMALRRGGVVGLLAIWAVLFALIAGATWYSDARKDRVRGDFADYSLAASRVMFAGGDPYEKEEVGRNFKYLPFNALLLRPFIGLPLPVAQGLWMGINGCALIGVILLHRRRLAAPVPWWVWVVALGLAARYFWQNLKMGQWNTSVYCLAFAGLYCAVRRPFRGGLLLGAAATIKYMPFFFVFYFAARRQWRAAAGLLVGILVCALIVPTLVLGPQRHARLLRDYREKIARVHQSMTVDETIISHSLRSKIYLMLTGAVKHSNDLEPRPMNLVELGPHVANRIATGFCLALLGGVMALTWRLARRREALLDARQDRTAAEWGRWLMLIEGLWFLTLLHISPELRKPHLLTIFTPVMGLMACAASVGGVGRGFGHGVRRTAGGCVAAALAMTLLSSQISDAFEYNDYMEYFGGFTAVTIILTVGVVVCLVRDRPEVH